MSSEAHRSFECFGGTAKVHVRGADTSSGEVAADEARSQLLDAHRRLSRFREESELTRLNRDPRGEVPAGLLLCRLAAAPLAEVHAKAALLSGPEHAAEWLPHDGGVDVVAAERSPGQLAVAS